MKFWDVLVVGAAEKKLPTALSLQLFGEVFSTFCGQKIRLNFFKKYCSIRTEKLHNIKLKKNI